MTLCSLQGRAMARQPRLDLPGAPQHVIQRGNNRQPCFLQEQDYRFYLEALREAAQQTGCRVHAYVLMTNHVHLLVTPEGGGAISCAMQRLGRRYVAYFNNAYRRSGTLWEGRFKACLVDSESYLLTCYRYIELNPVRAGMVKAPEGYAWSSYHANACGVGDPLVTPHAEYLSLGSTADKRRVAYRDLFSEAIADDHMREIRSYVQKQRALGTKRFQRVIEAELERVATVRKRGRPRKIVQP
jgi:putative transposase